MCIIFVAYQIRHDYPLVLIANRDEFYSRPTAPAGYWTDHPHIYAGRDLIGNGTWLGVTNGGRFAAVTNHRNPKMPKGSSTRGYLVSDFLASKTSCEDYLAKVESEAAKYSGFNLLVGEVSNDEDELWYYSNRFDAEPRKLHRGIYGLSNAFLDTPWPKVEKGRRKFEDLLSDMHFSTDSYFELLSNEERAHCDELPDTGIGQTAEHALSSIFIRTPEYGTRSSTVLTIDSDFIPSLIEKVHDSAE